MRLLRGSFWHPVRRTQAGLIPSGIPEAQTWAMMLIGFAGLAGAAAFRCKAAVAPAALA
jgi:hypothetical protein